jgi:hypothetical protein
MSLGITGGLDVVQRPYRAIEMSKPPVIPRTSFSLFFMLLFSSPFSLFMSFHLPIVFLFLSFLFSPPYLFIPFCVYHISQWHIDMDRSAANFLTEACFSKAVLPKVLLTRLTCFVRTRWGVLRTALALC